MNTTLLIVPLAIAVVGLVLIGGALAEVTVPGDRNVIVAAGVALLAAAAALHWGVPALLPSVMR